MVWVVTAFANLIKYPNESIRQVKKSELRLTARIPGISQWRNTAGTAIERLCVLLLLPQRVRQV
jgi:hypothetical protein